MMRQKKKERNEWTARQMAELGLCQEDLDLSKPLPPREDVVEDFGDKIARLLPKRGREEEKEVSERPQRVHKTVPEEKQQEESTRRFLKPISLDDPAYQKMIQDMQNVNIDLSPMELGQSDSVEIYD